MKIYCFLIIILFSSCSFINQTAAEKKVIYHINLNDRTDDTFKVTILPQNLSDQNNIYNFASTIPGTYRRIDMGRFVRSFKAFDANGNTLKTDTVSINQWKIEYPEKIAKIEYSITETWDTPVKNHPVYPMSGTSIEEDHALLNWGSVIGFFNGMQSTKIHVKIDYPTEWTSGSALTSNKNGYYLAESYDHLVDSPLLLGRLTKSSTTIDNTVIDVYTYSKTDKITSDKIMVSMEEMLTAASKFTNGLPVDHYTFLFHFEDASIGALEHSYSSTYVFKEDILDEKMTHSILSIAAHEFFHVITPLNIHSEIIATYNFKEPAASEHLWLYEGVTEWASDMMQLRDNLMGIEEYFKELTEKVTLDQGYFDKTMSLSHMSLNSYSPDGQRQYGNIYYRGALVGALLDIRLLELSGGKRGLREVILELSKKYGKSRAFSEKSFFSDLTKLTYPEIGEFISNYIQGTEPLPIKDYFIKLGINFHENKTIENTSDLGMTVRFKENELIVYDYDDAIIDMGIEEDDIITHINNEAVSAENYTILIKTVLNNNVGDKYLITIERNGRTKYLEMKLIGVNKTMRYAFELSKDASKEQIDFRTKWMKNL